MSTPETFLIAMTIIFTVPWLLWRFGNMDYYAPLVVVQIIAGILLGPGILGRAYPDYYALVFNPAVIQSLNGIAWWAVMLFVMIAGIELDLKKAWVHRRESPASPPAWRSARRSSSAARRRPCCSASQAGWDRRR